MPLKRPTPPPVPDEIFDEWLAVLGDAELRVLPYIVRRTFGFDKRAGDTISYTQFTDGITARDGRALDRGCGVRNRTNVAKALRMLLLTPKAAAQALGLSQSYLYELLASEMLPSITIGRTRRIPPPRAGGPRRGPRGRAVRLRAAPDSGDPQRAHLSGMCAAHPMARPAPPSAAPRFSALSRGKLPRKLRGWQSGVVTVRGASIGATATANGAASWISAD